MTSGFSGRGGAPDFFSAGGRSTSINGTSGANFNSQQQFSFRSPLSGALPDPSVQIRRPDFVGKRPLSEFQHQNQERLGFYLRNVKQRPNYQHATPISTLSPVDFSTVPSISPEVSSVPMLQQKGPQPLILSNSFFSTNLSVNKRNEETGTGTDLSGLGSQSENKTMNHRLHELEKELLGDEDDAEGVSDVTNSEWSDTIQNLVNPTRKPVSPSPASSSSSCCSTLASPPISCKQSFIDAAAAISDGKSEVAAEILTRLQQVANPRGTSEQKLAAYMVLALQSRVFPTEHPPPASELFGKEHVLSTQMLYEVSPCFKLGLMAANLVILDAASEQGFQKIHVLDFEIGQGGQYMHLLHALAATKSDNKRAAALTITTFTDFPTGGDQKLKIVGEGLKALANKIGVYFKFSIKNSNITDLSREKLGIEPDEALAVNFAFKLYKLPDESVTTDNIRDDLLRRVKSLSPAVTTVVEQEINANTAPLTVRVREASEHYGALFDSLEATVSAHNPDRARIEEALGRKLGNSVACEGRDRVERCELFGKWRVRLSMAGLRPVPMGQPVSESLRVKLNSGTRGNPGFTVIEQSGGICFGWIGRTLTVASAWR